LVCPPRSFSKRTMTKPKRSGPADERIYELQAKICKAFASPVRIHLLHLLGEGELGSQELQERLGITKTNLSQHLSVLRSAGVVAARRDGKQIFCSMALPEVKAACESVQAVLRLQIENAGKLAKKV
jgi:DNA-binding transcriptional ArsR family regulator